MEFFARRAARIALATLLVLIVVPATVHAAEPTTVEPTAAAVATDACGTPAIAGPYGTCTFADDFSGTTLNANNWVTMTTATTSFGTAGECYVDSPNNVKVGQGVLSLTVRKEAQPFTCVSPQGNFQSQYTGASVTTGSNFAQAYGRVEIRAKFPDTKVAGVHGALWMWPTDYYSKVWPASGEIDIAEFYSRYPDRAIPYLHYDSGADTTVTNNYCMIDPDVFHIYTTVWTPSAITIQIDGKTCINNRWNSGDPTVGPFDQPYFLALTQALGIGSNAFNAASTPLPATTQVDYVRVWDGAPTKPVQPTNPLAGTDRYDTAVKISRQTFKPGVRAVVVATGKSFADGLSGGPGTAKLKAPLLLVPGDRIPAGVVQEINRLSPERIYVLGGNGVVSTQVESQLRGLAPDVIRFAGADRYATAARSASLWPRADTVYLASGTGFPDALSGGATAAATGMPLLLTHPTALATATAGALQRLAPSKVVIVGGVGAISSAVIRDVQAALPRAAVTRIGGANRYETSAKLLASVHSAVSSVMLASGDNFPDALAGVPASIARGDAFALSRKGCMPVSVRTVLDRLSVSVFVLLGGTAVLNNAVTAVTCD